MPPQVLSFTRQQEPNPWAQEPGHKVNMRSEGGDKEVSMSPEALPPLLLQSAADRQMPVSPPSTVKHGAFGKETMWNKLGNGTGVREILNNHINHMLQISGTIILLFPRDNDN